MSRKRIINIGRLYGLGEGTDIKKGKGMSTVQHRDNAYLEIENGLIRLIGGMDELISDLVPTIDLKGKNVYPSYVDCHTHLVFAKTREQEFVDRCKGLSYQEIAERGGGILNSANKLRAMSEDQLFEESLERLHKVIRQGTGAIEIKSGYGLTVKDELKMLRVIRRLRDENLIPIKSTFLGAHAYPVEYANDHAGYIDLVVNEMLDAVKSEGLADYVDIFCEDGYFGLEETRKVLEAGLKAGLKARPHVNQFKSFGGVQLSAELGAISVEHLEELTQDDIESIKSSGMIPVALPGCSFFLSIPYTPVRSLIDQGLPVVLASDYNPGSSPMSNLSFIMSLGCVIQKMVPEEAFNALSWNASHAIELQEQVGSISVGKLANFFVTDQKIDINLIPYSVGDQLITDVFVKGDRF